MQKIDRDRLDENTGQIECGEEIGTVFLIDKETAITVKHYEFERITLVHRAGSDIYHDAVCARHYDRCLSDLIHFDQ